MNSKIIRNAIIIYGLVAIFVGIFAYLENLGGFLLIQLMPFTLIIFGWRVTFVDRGNSIIKFAEYYLGTLILSIGFFTSLVLFSPTSLLWAIIAFIFSIILLMWFWLPRLRNRGQNFKSKQTKTAESKDFGSQTSLLSLTGQNKQVSEVVKLDEGRYKLTYRFYSTDELNRLSVAFLDIDQLNAKDQIILYEEHSSHGSVVFTIPMNSRYVFNIDPWSWEAKQLSWEISIEKL